MRRTSNSINGLASLIIVIAAAGGLYWLSERTPKPGQLIDDGAKLLSREERDRVGDYHAFMLGDHDIDYRVVTARDVRDINQFAWATFERLASQMGSRSGRGLLLVIAPDDNQVRLEVSQALEGVYTDGFVKYVEERQMVPFFVSGRIADGILATTELIIARAQEAKAGAAFDDTNSPTISGGGGAVVMIDSAAASKENSDQMIVPGTTPEDTLGGYLAAMQHRNASPELAIYTPATQAMLRGWTITPAQMDNVARSLRACVQDGVHIRGDLAVIRYAIKQRGCAPFFFVKSPDGWLLDLTMMQKAIRFGRSNAWRFDLSVSHPYEYAFEDWRFDENGFPKAAQ